MIHEMCRITEVTIHQLRLQVAALDRISRSADVPEIER
jgi:hypothetical protein